MKQLVLINPENVSENEVATYPVREAARAIVFDENNLIALLHVSKEKYYKLPGGGIEQSEDKKIALERECLEEIGSHVEIIDGIGIIVEYRKIFHLKQISYCYLARVKGEKGKPNFTEEELENGFEQVWLPYDKALELLSNNIATNVEGRDYIVPRDIIFLTSAKNFLHKS